MKRERITVFASLIIGLVIAFSLYGYYARARRAEIMGMNITGNVSQIVKVHAMTKWGTPITITLRPESTSYMFYDPDNSSDKLNNTGEMISYLPLVDVSLWPRCYTIPAIQTDVLRASWLLYWRILIEDVELRGGCELDTVDRTHLDGTYAGLHNHRPHHTPRLALT